MEHEREKHYLPDGHAIQRILCNVLVPAIFRAFAWQLYVTKWLFDIFIRNIFDIALE